MHCRPLVAVTFAWLGGCNASERDMSLSDERYRVSDDGACVTDIGSGLVWERKVKTAGLRGWENTYSWFDPTADATEIDYRGTSDGGDCTGGSCDTWHYVETMNEAGLCGYTDWRMPTRDELSSISDPAGAESPPTSNAYAFPLMQADEYWSGNDYSFQPDAAWTWNFRYGHDRVDWKRSPKYVRLVRGTAVGLKPVKE